MTNKKDMPECPVATTVKLVGIKWKLLILRDLLSGTKRFNELYRSLKGISQKVLTENLKSMESDGIIVRTVYPEVPPKVEYTLSGIGERMKPVIDSMADWGNYYKALLEDDKKGL